MGAMAGRAIKLGPAPPPMDAVAEGARGFPVARLARDWRELFGVRDLLDAGVAVGALEGAVHGPFQLGGVHEQRDRLTPHFLLQALVRMAAEAILIARSRRSCTPEADRQDQEQADNSSPQDRTHHPHAGEAPMAQGTPARMAAPVQRIGTGCLERSAWQSMQQVWLMM